MLFNNDIKYCTCFFFQALAAANMGSPRSQSPRGNFASPSIAASTDVAGSRGRSKGGRQTAPSTKTKSVKDGVHPVPSLKRSSSSSNSLSKASKREQVNATPLVGSNSVTVKVPTSSSSSGCSTAVKGVKNRRGRLSINGQAVLGSLLDAEVQSFSASDDEDSLSSTQESGMLDKDSLKVIAGKFTAVMVKKRSRDAREEVGTHIFLPFCLFHYLLVIVFIIFLCVL